MRNVEHWAPVTVTLDTGGETWRDVGVRATRRLTELHPGAVLEVCFAEPSIFNDILSWCNAAGLERRYRFDDDGRLCVAVRHTPRSLS